MGLTSGDQPAPKPGAARARTVSGRTVVVGAALVAALFGVAYWVFRSLLWESPAPAPPVPPPTPPPASQPSSAPAGEGAVVAATRGQVELLAHGASWSAARVGARLGPDDAIRTGAGAEADLRLGERSTITVAERTQLAVREVAEAAQPLTLRRGRITADWKEGERRLVVEDESGKVVAATKAARFSVLAAGETFAVATETGVVNLDAAGSQVEVKEGQTSRVEKGASPSPVQPIAKELLLKVATAQRVGAEICAVIKGSTEPGAQVFVDGEPVAIDAEGSFSVSVPSRAGREGVRVTTRDAAGREREKMIACQTNTSPKEKPIEGMGVRWRVEGDD